MKKRQHRRYSTEFKLQVVQTYLDGGGSVKGIAAAHGIGHSLLLPSTSGSTLVGTPEARSTNAGATKSMSMRSRNACAT